MYIRRLLHYVHKQVMYIQKPFAISTLEDFCIMYIGRLLCIICIHKMLFCIPQSTLDDFLQYVHHKDFFALRNGNIFFPDVLRPSQHEKMRRLWDKNNSGHNVHTSVYNVFALLTRNTTGPSPSSFCYYSYRSLCFIQYYLCFCIINPDADIQLHSCNCTVVTTRYNIMW